MNLSKVRLSKDFRLLKAIETSYSYALPNYPTKEQIERGFKFANHVLQPIRNGIGIMLETSFFRAPLVNIMAGGVWDSQHLDFEACDFYPKEMSIAEAYEWIANPKNKIQFGQVILKPTFIHISQIRMGKPNQQCLAYKKAGGYSVYKDGPVRVLDY